MLKKYLRKPTSSGEILAEEFLKPMGLTQGELARHLHCDVKVINRIINQRSAVTAEMALRLGAAFKTTPDFWLKNAQQALNLYKASHNIINELPRALHKLKSSVLRSSHSRL